MKKPKREKLKEFVHIGNILDKTLRGYRRESAGEILRIGEIWDEIFDKSISENSRPSAFKDKILLVHASCPAWTHNLQFLKQEMIGKINTALGKELVQDIMVKVGDV